MKEAANNQILIAKITAPHGIGGFVRAKSFSDNPRRFNVGETIFLTEGGALLIEKSSIHKGDLLLKLQGIENRDDAEKLRDKELFVPEDSVPPLPDGEYYHYQLLGLKVREAGIDIGVISEIMGYRANDIYVVSREDGSELLLPALKSVIKKVDLDNGCMEVEVPEGL